MSGTQNAARALLLTNTFDVCMFRFLMYRLSMPGVMTPNVQVLLSVVLWFWYCTEHDFYHFLCLRWYFPSLFIDRFQHYISYFHLANAKYGVSANVHRRFFNRSAPTVTYVSWTKRNSLSHGTRCKKTRNEFLWTWLVSYALVEYAIMYMMHGQCFCDDSDSTLFLPPLQTLLVPCRGEKWRSLLKYPPGTGFREV